MELAELEVQFSGDTSAMLTALEDLKVLRERFRIAVDTLLERDFESLFTVESSTNTETFKVHVVFKPNDYVRGFIDALKMVNA